MLELYKKKVKDMLLKYKKWFPKIEKEAWIAPNSTIIGNVEIGKDSSIWFGTVIRGDVHYIKIGDRTSIQDISMVHVTHYKKEDMSDGNPTIIGNDVTIGHKVMLHGCIIEDACLIGMGATILDGAIIGKESIVGACSLVTKNKKFPPRSLIMGSPAKVIRELTDDEIEELYNSAKRYVQFKNGYLE
jgi:carbonic anhydrase/acetyltransferase-like protein (isoleucine patch superfamily)